jgi:hypothetical protein
MITEVIDEGSLVDIFPILGSQDHRRGELFDFLHQPAEFWQMAEGDRP